MENYFTVYTAVPFKVSVVFDSFQDVLNIHKVTLLIPKVNVSFIYWNVLFY